MCVPTNAYWWVTWDTSVKEQWPLHNGPGMSLWPTTPTGFLATPWPNRDHWITITYHMNSCHLLMGGSLGAETSLTDWNVQEISSILLTKCLFIFYFRTVYILKVKGSRFLWVFFYVSRTKSCRALKAYRQQENIRKHQLSYLFLVNR